MKRIAFLAAISLAFTVGFSFIPAQAHNTRSFVSAQSGLDTNPCTRAEPCRSFAYALTQTNAGGEIYTLDAGGYGTVMQVPSAGTGIAIGTGASVVNLRGLIIEGAGVGYTGIAFDGTGVSLTIEKCVIRNLTGDGIDFFPDASTNLAVSDTFIANNGGSGIFVEPGAVTATFNRVEVYKNDINGILVSGEDSTGTLNATLRTAWRPATTALAFSSARRQTAHRPT